MGPNSDITSLPLSHLFEIQRRVVFFDLSQTRPPRCPLSGLGSVGSYADGTRGGGPLIYFTRREVP